MYSIPEITVVPPMELDSIILCITNPLDTPLTVHLTETSPLPEVVLIPPVRLLHCDEINVIAKLSAKEDELLSSTVGGAIDVTHEEKNHANEDDDGIGGKHPGILRIKGNTVWIRIPVIHQHCNIDEENIVQNIVQGSASEAAAIRAVAIDMRIESEEDSNHAVCSTIIAWES